MTLPARMLACLAVLGAALLVAPSTSAQPGPRKGPEGGLEAEIAKLKAQIAALEAQLNRKGGDRKEEPKGPPFARKEGKGPGEMKKEFGPPWARDGKGGPPWAGKEGFPKGPFGKGFEMKKEFGRGPMDKKGEKGPERKGPEGKGRLAPEVSRALEQLERAVGALRKALEQQ